LKAANTLITASNGDLRKAIMFLQSGAKLHAGEKITASSINEMAGVLYLWRYMWITRMDPDRLCVADCST
jgi:hypothetical protein